MRLNFEDKGDGIYLKDVVAIYRWYTPLMTRPGTYRVIAIHDTGSVVNFYNDRVMPHPTCVVDDFGSLVKVPA